jgi:uncharacterized protein (DUF488 family)
LTAARAYTAGHSTHSLGDFAALLRGAGVRGVADVRAHPGSRRMPHFGREPLAAGLAAEGIAYAHLPALGGRRRPRPDSPNGAWEVEAFRGYADHMAGEEFAAGLVELERLAAQRPTAVVCAEAVWWRCHRRLVADALTARGWEVVHVGPDGRLTVHELPAFAVVETGGRVTYPPPQTALEVG